MQGYRAIVAGFNAPTAAIAFLVIDHDHACLFGLL
jgi:hypothetical protein